MPFNVSKEPFTLPEGVETPPGVKAATTVVKYKPDQDGTLTPGQWAANKGTEYHWLSGAAAGNKWFGDERLTEKVYDAAIQGAKDISIGHVPPPAKPKAP
jgi:hypothetical protein